MSEIGIAYTILVRKPEEMRRLKRSKRGWGNIHCHDLIVVWLIKTSFGLVTAFICFFQDHNKLLPLKITSSACIYKLWLTCNCTWTSGTNWDQLLLIFQLSCNFISRILTSPISSSLFRTLQPLLLSLEVQSPLVSAVERACSSNFSYLGRCGRTAKKSLASAFLFLF
jgi:hypothetical protein